jgi:simple sugar transport system substrate-binding protein
MNRLARLAFATAIAGTLLALAAPGHAAGYKFSYIIHSSTNNAFWGAVKKGMDDACKLIGADCQLVTVQNDGNLQEQLTNLEATIAQKPDGIITTLVNDDIFDEAVHNARAAGILVVAANVDDTKGAAGNERMSFIGQDLEQAGYDLAKAQSANFPKGDIHILLGVSGPGQSWAEQRMHGVARFLDEYKAAHKDWKVTYEKIDSGLDLSTTGSRVAAYVQAHPETKAYFDAGFWEAGAAQSLKDLGKKPGEILLAGFDLLPVVMDQMKAGYVQLTIDQQPYLQGFLPVMQLYLMNKFKLGAWDVNTGKAIVTPADVPALEALSKEGVR